MASVASRPRALPRVGSFPSGVAVPVLVLLVLMVFAVWHHTRALGQALWMDEGLSIGIASQPLFDIPHTLRVDGSPPLYYMLLGIWTRLVGDGPAETQGLSVAISLLAVPGGLWAGWTLFGRRAGYICAALFAFNGFLTAYAQETRMYALMITLSLLVTAAYLHVFVYGRRRYLPVFAVFVALMLYTHNWGMFVTAGLLIGLVPIWLWTEERRTLVRNALLGFGGALLLYLPWIPTLVHQVLHTGAPWLNRPHFGAPVQISKSLLGGLAVTTALILGAGSGLADVVRRRVEDPERRAVIVAATACIGTLAVAWLFSQFARLDHALPGGGARTHPAAGRPRPRPRRQPRPGGSRDRARDLGDPQDVRPDPQVERRRSGRRGLAAAPSRRPRGLDAARAGAAHRLPPEDPRPALRHPDGGGEEPEGHGLDRLTGPAPGRDHGPGPRPPAC